MPDGTVENWAIEAGSPNILMRRGITQNTLKAGTRSWSTGISRRTDRTEPTAGTLRCRMDNSCFWDSSGTGAPYEVPRPGVDTEVK